MNAYAICVASPFGILTFPAYSYIAPPDTPGREQIFRINLAKVPQDDTINTQVLASSTPGFSGKLFPVIYASFHCRVCAAFDNFDGNIRCRHCSCCTRSLYVCFEGKQGRCRASFTASFVESCHRHRTFLTNPCLLLGTSMTPLPVRPGPIYSSGQ